MKQTKLLICALVATLATGFTSCSSSDGDEGMETPVLSENEQKAYLDEVGREFLTHIQASEVRQVMDLVAFARDSYVTGSSSRAGGGYDTEAVEDWFDGCLRAIEGTPTTTTTLYGYKSVYKVLFRFTSFTGSFTAEPGGWKYTAASSNLQFNFRDGAGNNCVLKLETSGNKATAYMTTTEDRDYTYDYWAGYKENITQRVVDVEIPEHLTLTLTQGGATLAEVKVNTDITGLSGRYFNISTSSLNTTASVRVQNLSVNIDEKYTGNGSASVSARMFHNGQQILSMSASTGLSVSGNGLYTENADMEDLEVKEVKNANASIDVLGKVQLRGTVSDIMQYSKYMDESEEYDSETDGSNFRSCVNNANGLMNINLYYNGGTNAQAQFAFEPMQRTYKSYYSNYTYWEAVPVIRFDDGTKYTTFENFFKESEFRSLINAVEELVNSYEKEAENAGL